MVNWLYRALDPYQHHPGAPMGDVTYLTDICCRHAHMTDPNFCPVRDLNL